MRIVIVGAGAVGSYLASRLSNEGLDVVLVESDDARAARLQDSLDALVLPGNGASPATLEEAGCAEADLLIAVSNSDGVNILACHTARLLGAKRTVARIEDPDLLAGIADLGVDVVIDPGEMAAEEVLDLVRQTGVSDMIEFAEGELTLVGGVVRQASPLLGKTLIQLRTIHDDFSWVVVAIVRSGVTLPISGDTRVEHHDHILIMVRTESMARVRNLLKHQHPIERVVVLGATRVAELTTDLLLDHGVEVVVVDHDEDRCRMLADRHPKALVIWGDPTDPDILRELTLGDTDAVAALSGWDDVNLTACLVAKALGVETAVARFHRLAYAGLLIGTSIDAFVSSRLAAAETILRFVRRGRIRSVATFVDTEAEALDIEVSPGCAADEQRVQDLVLPDKTVIGGIARGDRAFVPDGNSRIHGNDRLIVFAPAEAIHDIEAMCAT